MAESRFAFFRRLLATPIVAACSLAVAQVTLTGPDTYFPGQRPDGIAAGDFNGDGLLDWAVASDNQDKVSVRLNAGGGAFPAQADYLTGAGTGPGALAAGDVDGDGDVDLVVVLKGINSVRILRNTGGGVFTQGPSAGVGLRPTDLALADFDRDGDLDIVTANRDGNSVTIVTNQGATIAATQTVPVALEPRQVDAANLNGDGYPDLAVTNHDSRSISVLLSTLGTFGPRTDYSVGASVRPTGIAAGDLDGDSDMDLAVTTSDNNINFLAIFRNGGNGAFVGPTNFLSGGLNSDSVVLTDLTGDRRLDAAISNEDSNNISVLVNAGNASFGPFQLFGSGIRPGFLAAGDFSDDLSPDLAVSNRDSNSVTVFINSTYSPMVSPSAFMVQPGVHVSGGLASFVNIDGNRFVAKRNIAADEAGYTITVDLDGTSPTANPSALGFVLRASVNAPSLTLHIELFDWVAARWIAVDERSAPMSDQTITAMAPGPVNRFVRPGTMAVRARIGWSDEAYDSDFAFSSMIDRAVWAIYR